MALIKLRKSNETAGEMGLPFIKSDQICTGRNTREVHKVDGIDKTLPTQSSRR